MQKALDKKPGLTATFGSLFGNLVWLQESLCQFDDLEKEITAHEERMAQIEKVLASPGEGDDIMSLTSEYLDNKIRLEAKTQEWTTLMEELDN